MVEHHDQADVAAIQSVDEDQLPRGVPVVEAAGQHLLGHGEEVLSVATRAAHDLDVALDAEVVVIHPIRPAKPKGRPSQTLSEPRHSTGPPLELGPEEIEVHSPCGGAARDAENRSHVPRPRQAAGSQVGRIGPAYSVHAVTNPSFEPRLRSVV